MLLLVCLFTTMIPMNTFAESNNYDEDMMKTLQKKPLKIS